MFTVDLLDMSSFLCVFDFKTLIRFLVVRQLISRELQIKSDPDLQFISLLFSETNTCYFLPHDTQKNIGRNIVF